MKTVWSLVVVIVVSLSLNAQTGGECSRELETFKTCFNNQKFDSVYAMLSDRIQGMVTADKMTQSLLGLYGQMGEIVSFDDRSDGKSPVRSFKTTFTRGVLMLMVSVSAEHKLDALRFVPFTESSGPKSESNFVLHVPGCDIFGTLTLPDGTKKVPVVLIIAGSGPTDRDGNSHLGVSADVYKIIADSLKQSGIACLRYDKRGVGESRDTSKSEMGLRFEDYVNDAELIIKKLRSDERFSKIIIAGHSEGSLIGMVAANHIAVDGYVSLAGAGERADKVLKSQFAQGDAETAVAAGRMLDSLVAGRMVTNTIPALESIFRKDIQPYLISWLKYDPQKEIARLKCPVAIVQGTMDVQVPYVDAEMLKKAKPSAHMVAVKGMNHVLKQVGEQANREENLAAYSNNKTPVCSQVIRELVRMSE